RGPCPMLNTLANHGILPHSGKNITEEITINALVDGVNFTPALGKFLFGFARLTNPDGNATTFNLDQLGTHNILEHDASLSRIDDYFDPSDAFNQAVFDETTSHWTSDIIDLPKAAISRQARATTSVKTNPAFTFSPLALGFAYGEVAAYLLVFGDRVAGTAPKSLVTSFFENERLPTHLGWVKPATPISNLVLCQMTQRVINATGSTLNKATQILPCSSFDA
ncbi:Chloroperoxidase, partial [Halenospora varia]